MNALPQESRDSATILRERARALARPAVAGDASGRSLEVLEFGIGDELYAFETSYVRGVHGLEGLAPLPGCPPFVAGIINVRGRILGVIDIGRFFDLPRKGLEDAHWIVILGGGDTEFGVMADQLGGVRPIPTEHVQEPLPTHTGVRREFLRGIAGERLAILDAGRILADSRIQGEAELES